jgi:hypothetical protein
MHWHQDNESLMNKIIHLFWVYLLLILTPSRTGRTTPGPFSETVLIDIITYSRL